MSTQAPNRSDIDRPPPPPPNQPPHRGMWVGGMTLGTVLVAIGVVALLATIGVDVPLQVVGPAILIVVGVGVLVSGIRGEPDHGGLGFVIFLGIVLTLASFATAVWEVPLGGGVGDSSHTPTAVGQDDYRWGIGDLTVDLRDAELDTGTTELDVSVVMGQVEVIVPEDMAVDVDAQVGAGAADVLSHNVQGVAVDNDQRSSGYADADRRLDLTIRVGLGEAVVTTR